MGANPTTDPHVTAAPAPRGRVRLLAALAASLLVLIPMGAGIGYLIGHQSGADVGAARDVGAQRGLQEGQLRGTDFYAQGQAAGLTETYGIAFNRAFKTAYVQAFRSAGMKPPKKSEIPVASQ